MHVYSIPMRVRFRGITRRTGLLFEGTAGWGEFCPFEEYDDDEAMAWLACALEAANEGWPAPVRDRIPVNCTVPVVSPERAHEIVARSGCSTAKVKVAESTLADDCARLEAVRDALGPKGFVRIDANMLWDVDTAVTAIKAMDKAAGGLQYVEQPCHTLDELASVRRRVAVPIAADESIRKADDPLKVAVSGAADIAVIKVAPLGGVRKALEVAEACGLPCVVSSALETSVGMAAGVALAAALPELDYACGLATLSLLDGDVTSDSLTPVDGYLPVLTTPPLPDRIAEFETGDLAWVERFQRVLSR
ncbi:o-succinylbenzoate synthase [Lentzea sp. BCCO 10_0061]|uniref:o-succinylbenzoate synthase n=1 Tax=Lentzea sokolovensis TaxID=3095429 RepID=A0ABU4UWP1_9PSEU|nr:o-succinylbenzoate synthase [Lentzea sp. BCCO 10_0061]MDX8143582.1 o-succinylbenzoate synthase [Lentzea sp. BCCO 10_0061]